MGDQRIPNVSQGGKDPTYEAPGRNLEQDGKPFRFQNKYTLLTYKTHIQKKIFITWIMQLIPSITWIRLAHETGEEGEYQHTHVLIDMGKAFQTRNPRFFDYEDIHPHIKILPNQKAFRDAQVYIGKEDPENQDLKKKPDWKEAVLNSRTTLDAIKYATRPGDISGIIQLHGLKKADYRTIPEPPITLRKWQQEIVDELHLRPDNRTIMWLFDREGNCGKTKLAEYLEEENPQAYLNASDLGTSRDAATIIENALTMGWSGHCILIDLERCTETHDRMYSYIECIKNGKITTQKYSGRVLRFDKPHVVVLANYPPKYQALSLDRWDVREITMIDHEWEIIKKKPKIKILRKTGADPCITSLTDGRKFWSSVPGQK